MSTLQDTLALTKASIYPDIGGYWKLMRTTAQYHDISVTSDGGRLIMCVYGGLVYTAQSGYPWSERSPSGSVENWYFSKLNKGSGQYCLVASAAGRLYTSDDYGATWTERQPGGDTNLNWRSGAISSDGSVMIAVSTGTGGRVYMSTDYGVNWTEKQPIDAADHDWHVAACDADASVIVVAVELGRAYRSTNSGTAWSEIQPAGAANRNWFDASIDSDGSHILMCENNSSTSYGRLWYTVNSGSSWSEPRPSGDTAYGWYRVALSSDGAYLLATGASTAGVWFSMDSATTWEEKHPEDGTAFWGADMKSDGSRLYMSAYNGGAYSSRTSEPSDALPIVYGDLSEGTVGAWKCPCINPSSYTYCYAGHAVLSAVNGNSITVYADGVEVPYTSYTFDEDNNYRGLGSIATIVFSSDQGSKVITVLGKGKPTTAGGSTLMTNVVDQINDLLTVEGGFAASIFNNTSKAEASAVFTAQGYSSAGIIAEDRTYEDIITEMMASFLGGAYKNGAGLLTLEIDDGTINSTGAPIIPRGDISILDIKQRLSNLVNQCPADYAYSYADGAFTAETDEAAYADAGSQLVYGVRKPSTPYPFYWCRNLTSINLMQGIIVDKFARPVYEIEFEAKGMKQIGLDVGDIFAMTIDRLCDTTGSPLYNQYWKVVSVSPNFTKGTIKFRALYTPYYMLKAGVRDTTIY